ncbi:transmembrane gamma-carboxyglutamic acid protein 2 [Engraulis encrasicolus]|uniref:transmembrane gamma-carboxyglutamic acid protein 2 n=1 Tax=Engraulis encrasicolus TaxID=184585 RepID=UPI002FD02CB7
MAGLATVCISMLVLHLSWGKAIIRDQNVFVSGESANVFLSRSLLYNYFDFEVVTQGNLERECVEEMCSYEEAREVFEDDALTQAYWQQNQESFVEVDVAGLVSGLVALVLVAVLVTVLGCYFYHNKGKDRRRSGNAPVQLADSRPGESIPLSQPPHPVPGLPSYNEALNRSGQYDAPPPPYSGGAPSEAPGPEEEGD